jgi:hypothetical protein
VVNLKPIFIAVLLMLLNSCSAQSMQAVSEALEIANQSMQESNARTSSILYPSATKLMLFGGRNNEVYLGCLSCSEYDQDSIANSYGMFGSAYQSDSIFNSYGEYGSRHSQYSACNQYASNPPVTVDSNGNFYGYLTLNNNKQLIQKNRQQIYTWLAEEVCS